MSASITSPLPLLKKSMDRLRPYAYVLLFLLFAATYGFMILRINALSNPSIDESAVAAAVKASPTPRLDETAAQQLKALKDNSVNVQTLFEQNRTDPFQE